MLAPLSAHGLFAVLTPFLLAQKGAQEPAADPQVLFADRGSLIQPQLAAREDGTLALACVGPKRTMYVAVCPPGAAWGELQPVAEEPDLAAGMHRGPRIAWAGDALVVSYIASRFDREKKKVVGSCNLSARRSIDGGRSWSSPVQINREPGSAAEGLHAMASRGAQVLIVWLDPRGGKKGMKLFAARSEDGGETYGADAPIYVSPSGTICECCHPSVAFGAGGRAAVLWRNEIDGERDMYVGFLGASARRLDDVAPCGTGRWKLAACPMDGGGLALGAEDLAVSVWRREADVYASFGARNERKLGAGKNPVVAVSGKRALAVWEGPSGLVGARFDARGEEEAPAVPQALGAGSFACVVPLKDSAFLVCAERGGATGLAVWEIDN